MYHFVDKSNCIYRSLTEWIGSADVLVRERGFSRFRKETQALYKVIGVSDMAAWQQAERRFEEIAPTELKKLLTGSGKATKKQVAEALPFYVGDHEYLCDDESDAVAVGIAWLKQNGLLRG